MSSRSIRYARASSPWPLAACLAVLPNTANAVPLAFPADQIFIPMAVGAAFALPAMVALAYVAAIGFFRRFGAIICVFALAAMLVAVVGYLQPGLVSSLVGRS